MFCMNCGATITGDTLAACGSCGKSNARMPSGAEVSRVIKEASSDALAAIGRVSTDPVGGLEASFQMLGEIRARSAGFAFGTAFAVLATLAAWIASSRMGMGTPKVLVAVFFVALAPFVAILGVSAGARSIFRGVGSIAPDVFTAGVSLQPLGLLFVLAVILGSANYKIVLALALLAVTYMICILFTGCTRLSGIPQRFAPLTVAVMLLALMWLTTIVAGALLDTTNPVSRFFS